MTRFIIPFGKLVIANLQFLHSIRCIETDILTRYLNPHAGETILDIGSGKGFYSGFLQSKKCHVFGIEPNPREVSMAQYIQDPKISFTVARGEEIPFPAAKFDKAVSVCVLEHTQDDAAVLKEVHRVLKKGGIFALSVDTLDAPHFTENYKKNHAKDHLVNQFYTRESLSKLLSKAGFELVESEYLFGSRISAVAMRVSSYFHFGLGYLVLFPILYPVLALDRWLNPNPSAGMILVLHAKKK